MSGDVESSGVTGRCSRYCTRGVGWDKERLCVSLGLLRGWNSSTGDEMTGCFGFSVVASVSGLPRDSGGSLKLVVKIR